LGSFAPVSGWAARPSMSAAPHDRKFKAHLFVAMCHFRTDAVQQKVAEMIEHLAPVYDDLGTLQPTAWMAG